MKISLIIPCRNERTHVSQGLESVFSQELEPGWELEILVADGMSDDGTAEILREIAAARPNLRIIDNPERIVSTGLNAAILQATGEVIIRMDMHSVYASDFVRECVHALERSGADNVGGPIVAVGRGVIGKAIAAAFQSPFSTGGGKAHDPNYEGEVDTVFPGCWRASTFEKTGLFDPALVRNQDDEFNFRLRRMGGRIWQSPRIRLQYTPRASIKALFRQYLQYGFWKVAVIRKHGALASWRHAVPVMFVGSVALGAALASLALALSIHQAAEWIAAGLGAELVAYTAVLFAAAMQCSGSLGVPVRMALPLVLCVYHVSYGCGFLAGLIKPVRRSPEGQDRLSMFTELTR